VMLGSLLIRLILKERSIRGAIRAHPAFVVFAIAMIVYVANGRTISGGDSVPAKNLPVAILRHGTFYLDQLKTPDAKRVPYYLRQVGDHYVSDYPVGAALFAIPFYALPIELGVDTQSRIYAELEKVSAATMVALSAAILCLAAVRLDETWIALIIAGTY